MTDQERKEFDEKYVELLSAALASYKHYGADHFITRVAATMLDIVSLLHGLYCAKVNLESNVREMYFATARACASSANLFIKDAAAIENTQANGFFEKRKKAKVFKEAKKEDFFVTADGITFILIQWEGWDLLKYDPDALPHEGVRKALSSDLDEFKAFMRCKDPHDYVQKYVPTMFETIKKVAERRDQKDVPQTASEIDELYQGECKWQG